MTSRGTNSSSSLPEMIDQERSEGPQPDDNPSTRIRRRVLNGESFTYKELAAVEGGSEPLGSMVLRNLRGLGFVFESERITIGKRANGTTIYAKRYTCTNPDRSVDAMKRSSIKTRNAVAVVEAKTATEPPRPERPERPAPAPQEQLSLDDELLPLPAVDSQLTVYLAMRERDGTTRIGLRNGSQSWLLTIDAHAVEAGT